MTGFTQGEWYVCSGEECEDPYCTAIYVNFPEDDETPYGQGVLHADGKKITPEQARANAVLMAQAPKLLQHLEEAMKMLGLRRTMNPGVALFLKSAEEVVAAALGDGDG